MSKEPAFGLERSGLQTVEKRCCGTCDYWEFGHRSYCSWGFYRGAEAVSSAYKAGGECHAMGGDDGKDCQTWVERDLALPNGER